MALRLVFVGVEVAACAGGAGVTAAGGVASALAVGVVVDPGVATGVAACAGAEIAKIDSATALITAKSVAIVESRRMVPPLFADHQRCAT